MASNHTAKMIRKAFIKMLNERQLSKITVKDIVTQCNINRNTFYYHFADIYDLLSQIFQSELQIVIEKYNDKLSWEEAFLVAAESALENKKAVYHVYNSMRREELTNYVHSVSGNIMEKYVEKESEQISAKKEDKLLIASFYQCALTAMVIEWVATGMKDDPEISVRRIGELFKGHITNSLERSAGLH